MKKITMILSVTALLLGAFTATASAQTVGVADDCSHDRARGECSPGTSAPSQDAMMAVITSGSTQSLMSTLEYGQLVDCHACVVPLMNRVLEDDSARAREFGAWWLRQRTFSASMAFDFFRRTLEGDTDPVRRARAAEAVGEFLTPHAVPLLTEALTDLDAGVREAAVRGLGRTNHIQSQLGIATAMADAAPEVRLAAVKQVNLINAFTQFDSLIGALADADASVRQEAALQAGQRNVTDAVPALSALLTADEDANVRRAAAWALGSIGGSEAQTALGDALATESDENVLQAISIARQMR
jgi:HEAT repeat protein